MSEKWYFNETISGLPAPQQVVYEYNFTSNGAQWKNVFMVPSVAGVMYSLVSGNSEIVYTKYSGWVNEAYRTIELTEPAAGDFLSFLQQNATNISSGPVDPTPVKLINKVVLGSDTVLDLTSDTVTPETLLVGTTAHNAAGETITGTLTPCTVYSAYSPASELSSEKYLTWTIPAADHGFSSRNLIVSVYKSTGQQVLCDVQVSPANYGVTIGLFYESSISTYAGGEDTASSIPAGEFKAVIVGPVETPAAVQQAMLNQLPVYTGGGNY